MATMRIRSKSSSVSISTAVRGRTSSVYRIQNHCNRTGLSMTTLIALESFAPVTKTRTSSDTKTTATPLGKSLDETPTLQACDLAITRLTRVIRTVCLTLTILLSNIRQWPTMLTGHMLLTTMRVMTPRPSMQGKDKNSTGRVSTIEQQQLTSSLLNRTGTTTSTLVAMCRPTTQTTRGDRMSCPLRCKIRNSPTLPLNQCTKCQRTSTGPIPT